MRALLQGLCEEAGDPSPREVRLHPDEEPVQVVAGNGLSLVVTRAGNVYAFGNGRYGVLGCGDEETSQVPRQLLSLAGKAVRKVAAGAHHVLALTYSGRVLSWGKNDKGQCGLGVEGGAQLTPTAIGN
jgi:alpha-tubulin suppressor-like RCC1 family protein